LNISADEAHRQQIEKLRSQGLQLIADDKEVVLASDKLSGKSVYYLRRI
jgi:DNA ligase (NAD+)